MPNPCAPNTSEPKTGLGPIIVYDATQLVNFLISQGMGWLSAYAPKIGGRSYDLASFCAADPPPAPTTDPATILNFFSPLNPTGAADLLNWLIQIADYFVWFQDCQCSAGPQPTPPSAIPQPTGLDQSPPNTGTPPGTPCSNSNLFASVDNTATVQLRYMNSTIATSLLNVTGVTFKRSRGIISGTSFQVKCEFGYLNSSGSAIPLGAEILGAGGIPNTATVAFSVPPGAFSLYETWSPVSGTYQISVDDEISVFCGGTSPTGSASACCPADPTLLAILEQVKDDVQFILSIIPVRVPNYAAGTSHSGLSDGGALSLESTTIALKVVFDTLPISFGEVIGTPNTFIDIGFVTPLTNQGVEAGIRLSRQTQVIPLPEASSGINYTFPSGASVTITELQAG